MFQFSRRFTTFRLSNRTLKITLQLWRGRPTIFKTYLRRPWTVVIQYSDRCNEISSAVSSVSQILSSIVFLVPFGLPSRILDLDRMMGTGFVSYVLVCSFFSFYNIFLLVTYSRFSRPLSAFQSTLNSLSFRMVTCCIGLSVLYETNFKRRLQCIVILLLHCKDETKRGRVNQPASDCRRVMPNTHRRRRRNTIVELRRVTRVGGVNAPVVSRDPVSNFLRQSHNL